MVLLSGFLCAVPLQGCTWPKTNDSLSTRFTRHVAAQPDPRKLIYFLDPQAVTMAGDGYRGRMSPHTPNEKFEGATVLKTLQVLATQNAHSAVPGTALLG